MRIWRKGAWRKDLIKRSRRPRRENIEIAEALSCYVKRLKGNFIPFIGHASHPFSLPRFFLFFM
jgi:hypothetical protein